MLSTSLGFHRFGVQQICLSPDLGFRRFEIPQTWDSAGLEFRRFEIPQTWDSIGLGFRRFGIPRVWDSTSLGFHEFGIPQDSDLQKGRGRIAVVRVSSELIHLQRRRGNRVIRVYPNHPATSHHLPPPSPPSQPRQPSPPTLISSYPNQTRHA